MPEYRCHRADVDNLPAARRRHVRIRLPARQERSGQVDVHYEIPVVQRVVLRRLANPDSRVVHQNVDAAELAERELHHIGDLIFVLHIRRCADCADAQRLQLRHRRRRLFGVARRDQDVRARLRQSHRDAKPYAAVAPRNYRCLPAQVKHSVGHVLLPSLMNQIPILSIPYIDVSSPP